MADQFQEASKIECFGQHLQHGLHVDEAARFRLLLAFAAR
jgi:hypothetical protein